MNTQEMHARAPLVACPFCGGEPAWNLDQSRSDEYTLGFWVSCKKCGSRGPRRDATVIGAQDDHLFDEPFFDLVKLWNQSALNRRAPLTHALAQAVRNLHPRQRTPELADALEAYTVGDYHPNTIKEPK